MKKIKNVKRVRRSKCRTCVFRREEDGGCVLAPGRRAEIELKVLQGVNQLCHEENDQAVCRGGREFQLTLWHRLGIIEAPTDAALRKAMRAAGVEPGPHV